MQVNNIKTAFTQTALDVCRAWPFNNVKSSKQPQWKEAAEFPDSLFPEEGRCKDIELWAERVGNHGVPLQPTPCLLLSFSLTPRVTAKTHAARLHLLSFLSAHSYRIFVLLTLIRLPRCCHTCCLIWSRLSACGLTAGKKWVLTVPCN